MRRACLLLAAVTTAVSVVVLVAGTAEWPSLREWFATGGAPARAEAEDSVRPSAQECLNCMQHKCYSVSTCGTHLDVDDPHGVDHDRCMCGCCKVACSMGMHCNTSRTLPAAPSREDPSIAAFFHSLDQSAPKAHVVEGSGFQVVRRAPSLVAEDAPGGHHPCRGAAHNPILDAVHLDHSSAHCTQVCLPQAFRDVGMKHGITYGSGTCWDQGFGAFVTEGTHAGVPYFVYSSSAAATRRA